MSLQRIELAQRDKEFLINEVERLSSEHRALQKLAQAALDDWKSGIDVAGPMHNLHSYLAYPVSGTRT